MKHLDEDELAIEYHELVRSGEIDPHECTLDQYIRYKSEEAMDHAYDRWKQERDDE